MEFCFYLAMHMDGRQTVPACLLRSAYRSMYREFSPSEMERKRNLACMA